MDGNTRYYAANVTDFHEQTINCYNIIHNRQLTTKELIKHAIRQDNYKLVDYLISRRLCYIIMQIDIKTKCFGFFKNNLEEVMDDYTHLGMDPKIYYNNILYFAQELGNKNQITIEDLIEQAHLMQDYRMMFYIYAYERMEIINFARQEDAKHEESLKPKHRKFFILQF